MGMKRSYSLTFFLHFLTIHKNPTQWLKNLLYSKKDDTKGNRYVFHTCMKKHIDLTHCLEKSSLTNGDSML